MHNAIQFQTDKFPWWKIDLNMDDPEAVRAGKELAEFLCGKLAGWGFDVASLEGDEYGWTLQQKKQTVTFRLRRGPFHQIIVNVIDCNKQSTEDCWRVEVYSAGRTVEIGRFGFSGYYEPYQTLLDEIEQALTALGVNRLEKIEF